MSLLTQVSSHPKIQNHYEATLSVPVNINGVCLLRVVFSVCPLLTQFIRGVEKISLTLSKPNCSFQTIPLTGWPHLHFPGMERWTEIETEKRKKFPPLIFPQEIGRSEE